MTALTARKYIQLVHYSGTAEVRLKFGGSAVEVRWKYGGSTVSATCLVLSCSEKTLQCAGIDADLALR